MFPVSAFFLEGIMKTKNNEEYQSSEDLKEILSESLLSRKFILDCGHRVTFGYFLGNSIVVYNGKELRIVCSQCGY